jgi:hypothetical protein
MDSERAKQLKEKSYKLFLAVLWSIKKQKYELYSHFYERDLLPIVEDGLVHIGANTRQSCV